MKIWTFSIKQILYFVRFLSRIWLKTYTRISFFTINLSTNRLKYKNQLRLLGTRPWYNKRVKARSGWDFCSRLQEWTNVKEGNWSFGIHHALSITVAALRGRNVCIKAILCRVPLINLIPNAFLLHSIFKTFPIFHDNRYSLQKYGQKRFTSSFRKFV